MWILIVLCGGAGGFLGFRYNQNIVFVSTAVVGAYMIIRPFGWMVGGFPNEFHIVA